MENLAQQVAEAEDQSRKSAKPLFPVRGLCSSSMFNPLNPFYTEHKTA